MQPSGTQVEEALRQARALGLERLDAQLLLAHRLQRPRTWLLAHGDAELPAEDAQAFHELCTARARGVPLAYLVGRHEFWGLDLEVTPAVLDPRQDTEVLVAWALDCLAGPLAAVATPRVADLGTGSGAIALAIRSACPRAEVVAVDRSTAALVIAKANAQRLGLPIDCRLGSWLEPVRTELFDLIVSNPPYLSETDVHLPQLHAEPREALVAGPQGLEDLQAIVHQASASLRPGGWLLLEHGAEQGSDVAALFRTAGSWVDLDQRRDLAGHVRCTGARQPPAG